MSLTPRQRALYLDIVDIYKLDLSAVGSNKQQRALMYDSTPDYSNVKCLRFSSPENIDFSDYVGRLSQDDLFTLEAFHFEVGTSIDDGDFLQLKTTADPEYGVMFQVKGFGRSRINKGIRKANYLRVYAQRLPDPQINTGLVPV